MRKKCTNNKCRKYFVVRAETANCPYCGKKYPRLNNASKATNMDEFKKLFKSNHLKNKEIDSLRMLLGEIPIKKNPKGVYLMGYKSTSKVNVIKVVRKWTGKGLIDAKELVESVPVLIEIKEIGFNYLNSVTIGSMGEPIIPDGSPLECFTKELDETGCLYKITY